MNINISDKIVYIGAGCGIGLILGALLAPQSGREIRQELSNKVDELSHKVQEKVQAAGIKDSASQTWQNVVEKGKNVASIGKQRLNDSIEAGRRRFNESIEEDEGLVER